MNVTKARELKGKGTYHQKDALEAAGLLIAPPRPDFIGNGRDKICWMTPPVIFLAQLAINPRRPPRLCFPAQPSPALPCCPAQALPSPAMTLLAVSKQPTLPLCPDVLPSQPVPLQRAQPFPPPHETMPNPHTRPEPQRPPFCRPPIPFMAIPKVNHPLTQSLASSSSKFSHQFHERLSEAPHRELDTLSFVCLPEKAKP